MRKDGKKRRVVRNGNIEDGRKNPRMRKQKKKLPINVFCNVILHIAGIVL
jgi:hypothetical protein